MAKINKVSREHIWQVKIEVDDPGCIWNVNPSCSYYKIVRANNAVAAARGAASYCSKQMQEFPGVHFKYCSQDIKPYFCTMYQPVIIAEDSTGIKRTKI
jgi:hypothetical protein